MSHPTINLGRLIEEFQDGVTVLGPDAKVLTYDSGGQAREMWEAHAILFAKRRRAVRSSSP
jgi:hypothetical protein